ncbi:SusC/RagA family TonB-linked outer membrane protein [Pedobacter frigoris]|uniref:SusC/RagA family TonB-linked outer membrane protein n=1 Tax=Pedobacter frigoris TaxID=2571272 RepID=UPI00292E0CA0|nr:SusC/RagA family TonB-linked outer membrane protein [Pedobacter frigoris]
MIKNNTSTKASAFTQLLKRGLTYSFVCAIVPVYSIAQQKFPTTADSLSADKMDGKLPYIKRGVNVWNGVISREANLGGTSTIYSESISTTPVADITNVMAGRLPGLYTLQSSAAPGNDAASFGLRGKTPLIVIDGVIRSFTSFNPNDIKSITVMKDALSTAMFGLRSSNGVVYITTKDRAENKPFELNFTAQYGNLQHLNTPNFITGDNYAKLYNEAQKNTSPNAIPFYDASTIAAYQNGTNNKFLQPSTNWYDLVYKKQSSQQRYNIDVMGNSKSYRYYASIENFSSKGNFLTDADNTYNTNNFYKRYNVRANAQMNFNEDISLSLNVFGSVESNNQPGAGSSNIMNSIYSTSPLAYAPKNEDGTYGGSATISNNILGSTVNRGYITSSNRTVNVDATLLYKLDDITEGLWTQGTLSINNYYAQTTSRVKTFAVFYPTTTGSGTTFTKVGNDGVLDATNGSYSIDGQFKQTYTNFLLGYDKEFDDHSISLLASYNNDNILESYTQLNRIYQNAGLTARYNYKGKYLAEAVGNFSAFNRYAPGNRWGFLPSFGLGWVVSSEDWFKSGAISFLKLRGTLGQTAWGAPGYYNYLQTYTIGSTGYVFGTGLGSVSGISENSVAALGQTWEKAWKYDVGLEAGFFNNKLNSSFTYYSNRYYDLLQEKGGGYSSAIFGQTYPNENIGKQSFSGFEATLNYADKANGAKFGYELGANVSIEQSKIIDNDEPTLPYSWLYKKGSPVTQTRGYEAIGFYKQGENSGNTPSILGYNPQPGDLKYKDLNNDGVINFLDQKLINSTKPRIYFGFNFGFNYKNFDLTGLLQGIVNRQVTLSPSSMSAFSNGTGYVLDYSTENRWTTENNVDATLPRLTLGGNTNNTQTSTFWIKDADYLRLKNLELGYSFPAKLLGKAKINKLRLFVNAYNLFTVTDLDYFDPESQLSGFSNQRIINGGISLRL